MSISDEDTTSKRSSSTKSPPRKIRHCDPQNDEINTKDLRTITLTREEVIQYAHDQVREVLNHEEYRRSNDIVVIPSLVSLRSIAEFYNPDGDASDAAAAPALDSTAVNSFDCTSSFPALGDDRRSNTMMPLLRSRQNNSLNLNGDNIDESTSGGQEQQSKRPITPPIGPQGAPIPQHIFQQQRNSTQNVASAATGYTTFNNTATLNEPVSPTPRQIFTTNYQNVNAQLSAPGRLGSSSMMQLRNNPANVRPGSGGKSEVKHINVVQSLSEAVARMERRIEEGESANANANANISPSTNTAADSISAFGQSPRTSSRQAPLTPQRAKHSVPLTPKQSSLYKDNIDELESSTITQLTEVMLHPPVCKVVHCQDEKETFVQYTWNKDDNGNDREKNTNAELDSPIKRNYKVNESTQQPLNTFIDATLNVQFNVQSSNTVKSRYPDSQSAHAEIAMIGLSIPRRVCQHPFKKNDIVWVCRTCQSDETCVLCHECFTNSNHEGHDVAFYHAQAGGCCDCGDADAWDPKGFCNVHGNAYGKGAPAGSTVAKVEPSVLGGVSACTEWLVNVVRDGVEEAYNRANPALLRDHKKREDAKKLVGRSESSSASCNRKDDADTRQMMTQRRELSLSRHNNVADMDTIDTETSTPKLAPTKSSNMLHEVQFIPAAASYSKKWSNSKPEASPDQNDSHRQFDPEAAGARATKKAKAPLEQTPAKILGELGREEQGLFLVLHAHDSHTGTQRQTVEALKELYSSPGGGGRPDTVSLSSAARAIDALSFGSSYIPHGPFAREVNLPNLGARLGRDANHFLFRAPQVDAIINKILSVNKKHGNIVVWGTQEIIAESGAVISRCWLDGDSDSSAMIGAAMLNRAKILTDRGLVCSIKTYHNLTNDQRATAVIRLISSLAESCDPLCDEVSAGISGRGMFPTLNAIIRSDLKLPCKFTLSWHALLLTLLAQPDFKAALANAYCETYRDVLMEYSRGVGVVDRSAFTLSVQFLNRVAYVTDLVRDRSLLSKLSKSLLETMSAASFIPGSLGSPTPAGASRDTLTQLSSLRTESSNLAAVLMALLGSFSFDEDYMLLDLDRELENAINDLSCGDSRYHGHTTMPMSYRSNEHTPTTDSLIERTQALVNPTLNPTHPFLQNRRYSPCISDLKCVLNVKGMSRLFLSLPNSDATEAKTPAIDEGIAIDNWIKILSLAQNMDAQMWRSYQIGHTESEHRGWVGAFNTSISLGSVYERLLNWEDSDPCILGEPSSMRLLSCAEVAHYTLLGVNRWQRSEMLSYRSTPHPSCTTGVPLHVLCPAALPFSTVATDHGTNLAMAALPLSQIQAWSFHLPLHRFTAAVIREVCRRGESGGIYDLLRMFEIPEDTKKNIAHSQHRRAALLFRGIMEFPVIVLSRSAQIKAGIWRRNGSGMMDQVLNYSEPPFCKSLQDSDVLLVQFSLVCHALHQSTRSYLESLGQSGTSRLVNLLLHRFGVFDFLGFENAPSSDVHRYSRETQAGLYPKEIKAPATSTNFDAIPWTYSPAKDFSTAINLVEELLLLIIILITEMPSPPALNSNEWVAEARRRLRREVIHKLASGPKTHSEMAEVHHVLSQRDNLILCDEGKHINPDDASGAALESVLNEVAIRRTRLGAADQWEMKIQMWKEYDPAFHRIATRAHQCATEQRPKQPFGSYSPYAPKPPPAHNSFKRIRKDLTSDATVLSVVYRVLHAYCYNKRSPKSKMALRGKEMYEGGTKSEASLARAVHILTLGAYAWQDDSPSDVIEIGSIFYNLRTTPRAKDWVDMVFLRDPCKIMKSDWYQDEESILLLLKRITTEHMANDHGLITGASWLCEWACKCNPSASILLGTNSDMAESISDGNTELEKRRAIAKVRQQQAMEQMKVQMAKFAEAVSQDEDAEMSVQESKSFEEPILSTPIRNRDTSPVHAMYLSPGEFVLNTPLPSTPKTPRTPSSVTTTPKSSHPTINHLIRCPQCIICGTDSANIQFNEKNVVPKNDKTLAFCAYAQASTVGKGGGGMINDQSEDYMRHVGVFVNLCGHAVHASCCESYLNTVNRDDRYMNRLEGGKKKEFRCPLCQRLSNSLVPFVDVDVDWIDPLESSESEKEIEIEPDESSLHKFLSSSNWWSSINGEYIWDGHAAFTDATEKEISFPQLSKQGHFANKVVFGKKDLILAWNHVLKTPRLKQRSSSETSNRTSDDSGVSDVWRRFMDAVCDSAIKADTKRLGGDTITNDYGEFRHYLYEKSYYNKMNTAAGKEPQEWPSCISSAALSEPRRQELSKEKLLSKLLFTIQSFTYSCCCEAAEARREFFNASMNGVPDADASVILTHFGVERALFRGNILLFPRAMSSVDGGSQPFNGRLGKLRYLALAIMSACSPLSYEITQLCMSFPFSRNTSFDPFDFDKHLQESEKKRFPVVYPLLRSHVLTHTTCCLISVTGRARTNQNSWDVNSTANSCRQFVTLGLIARLAQYLLSHLIPGWTISDWKRNLGSVLQHMKALKTNADVNGYSNEWFKSCLMILELLVGTEEIGSSTTVINMNLAQSISQAIESSKLIAIEFLRDIVVIQQILIPNVFSGLHYDEPASVLDETDVTLKYLMTLLKIDDLSKLMRSHLVEEIIKNWCKEATEISPTHLETRGIFSNRSWPQTPVAYHKTDKRISMVPLFGCYKFVHDSESLCRVSGLPSSYTDLYAELVLLCPDCEQIALCLVCGEVLDASGKGQCSQHAFKCGGGAGIFFLLQECVSLMIHGVKAAYIHSPYVDSHGETPQYRGRPLNLDESRLEILRKLWSGHKLREKTIAERETNRQQIVPNFY